MPLYTPGRRRAIVLLLLTSVLLLTLDLRGNAVFDAARTGFNKVMEPLESAADVATRPVVNAWRGITQWEDVRDENDRLRDQLAAQRADQIAAQAAIQAQQELLAERDLPALGDYPRITASVVGVRPSNLDQVVDIDKGSADGIEVGMAVVAPGGLIGKITTPLLPHQARVMLITDSNYATAAKVIAGTPPTTTTTTTAPPPGSDPGSSVPGSVVVDPSAPSAPSASTSPTASTAPPTSAPADSVPVTTPPATPPVETTPPESTTTTTVGVDMTLQRDSGQFQGRGPASLPQVDLLDDAPSLGLIVVGDLVFTAGGADFLAPPDIPIGVVKNVIRRSAAEGPLLEVEPSADLDRLHYVDIVVFRPEAEASGDSTPQADGG
jgi:rod shape-determining protein MreC